jgi:hypothetical protein
MLAALGVNECLRMCITLLNSRVNDDDRTERETIASRSPTDRRQIAASSRTTKAPFIDTRANLGIRVATLFPPLPSALPAVPCGKR